MTMPSVGRIVHYMARGSADGVFPPVCRAAVVTEVPIQKDGMERIGLCVLNPTGVFFDQGIPYDESTPGSWHWPERV